ncbi:MAG: NAD(P)H-binding protein [Anaerolineae bacterium]|nr:NAD(P)H-binding protein [Anaerolineae bacterium]
MQTQINNPATVLVTGATGTLGREVVKQLLQHSHHVRAFTRQSSPTVPQGVNIYQGDIRARSGLAEATKGVDTIIHCASFFESGYETDIQGTRHLIEAAKANGSPHLVYISIVGIDRSPFTYFQAKLEAERLVEQSNLPWTILRATQFHDYVLSLITSWTDENTSTITIPDGVRFQSVDVREVADSLVNLAEQPAAGHVPDLGGPEILMLEAMVDTYQLIYHKQNAVRTETLPGEYFDAFRSDVKLAPDRAVGQITWESFLQERAIVETAS